MYRCLTSSYETLNKTIGGELMRVTSIDISDDFESFSISFDVRGLFVGCYDDDDIYIVDDSGNHHVISI
jgi:hypothetical protein